MLDGQGGGREEARKGEGRGKEGRRKGGWIKGLSERVRAVSAYKHR